MFSGVNACVNAGTNTQKNLGSSHASTSNLEVVGYQLLLVPPLECSIRYIIKGLHDVDAVGEGNSRPLYCAPSSTACI